MGRPVRPRDHSQPPRGTARAASPGGRMSDEPAADPAFEELLTHLRQSRGFDFGGYKRTTLDRRIRKRMQAVGVNTFTEYADYLAVHPDEFAHLFDTILI